MKHLWTVLWTLNERIRRGHPVLVEVLLSQTIAPIQLQVQTKDALLKPGMGKQGEYSLAHSRGPGARANSLLNVALRNKSHPH